jgi:hypothetical protein
VRGRGLYGSSFLKELDFSGTYLDPSGSHAAPNRRFGDARMGGLGWPPAVDRAVRPSRCVGDGECADLEGVTVHVRVKADGIVGNLPVEERLDRLETGLVEERDARIAQGWQIEDRMAATADTAAHRVEQALSPRISEAVSYLAGLGKRPTWRPWWLGPALVLAGTVLGGIVSVIDAA